jgi:predicted RecB family nuclease
MLITDEIFCAFLKCETKAYLKYSNVVGDQCEYSDWQRHLAEDYKQKCSAKLYSNFSEGECLLGTSLSQRLENSKYRLVLDCLVQAQGLQTKIHALERLSAPVKRKHNPYIPIRFVPNEKFTKHDKLLLAFDALTLYRASGKPSLYGQIIYGNEQKTLKVNLAELMNVTQSNIEKIAAQQASPTPPPLILNKHCPECEFKSQCRQQAIEKDDLSLLSSMSEKERKKQHSKGIFSVTQLSYTYRPRRKPRRLTTKFDKYSFALKALAIKYPNRISLNQDRTPRTVSSGSTRPPPALA